MGAHFDALTCEQMDAVRWHVRREEERSRDDPAFKVTNIDQLQEALASDAETVGRITASYKLHLETEYRRTGGKSIGKICR